MASVETTIQTAFVDYLTTNATALKIDTRTIKVLREIPEERLGKRNLPYVVVNRPSRVADASRAYDDRTRTYELRLQSVDGLHVSTVKIRESHDRVEELRDNVLSKIMESRHVGLVELSVFTSMMEISPGETAVVDDQLLALNFTLSISTIE